MNQSLTLTKKEVAERQLNTAIHLFFQNADTVSIHTLAGATYEILEVLTRGKRKFDIMQNASCIRPEKKEEFLKIFKKAQTFFKHAKRDPSVNIKFTAFQTEIMLFDCVQMYMCLTGQKTAEVHVYNIWFLMRYPEYFNYHKDPNDLLFKFFARAKEAGATPKNLQSFADVIPLLKKSGSFPVGLPEK